MTRAESIRALAEVTVAAEIVTVSTALNREIAEGIRAGWISLDEARRMIGVSERLVADSKALLAEVSK